MKGAEGRSTVQAQKRELQDRLDKREVGNLAQLEAVVRHAGLQVTRRGRDYIGLRRPDGAKFRVRFDFCSPVPAQREVGSNGQSKSSDLTAGARQRHYAIYGLFSFSSTSERRACYIGQSVNMTRRLREHLARKSGQRGSHELFDWAAMEDLPVLCIVLQAAHCVQETALSRERDWLQRALDAGFEAPGVLRWGRDIFPQCERPLPVAWPDHIIRLAARPISDVVSGRSQLPFLEGLSIEA